MGDERPRDERDGEPREPGGAANLERGSPAPGPFEALTPRELEILKLLVDGEGNKSIARVVGIGEDTVKKHVSGILRKLGVSNRAAAAAAYEKHLASAQRARDKRES